MQPSEAAAFKKVLQGVHDFYGKDLSEFALSVWWQAMRPYDFETVKDAMNRHAVNPDNGQFLPKPADVVKLVGGGSQDSALMAWAKVDRAVRSVGMYRSVVFDDPLIHRTVVDMGGWTSFVMKTEDEWPFVRNHFVNLYRGYRSRSQAVEYPRHLPGLEEGHNRSQGFKIEPPLMLGNPEACQRVFGGGSDAPLLQVRSMIDHARLPA